MDDRDVTTPWEAGLLSWRNEHLAAAVTDYGERGDEPRTSIAIFRVPEP